MKKIASIFPHLLLANTQQFCRSEICLFGPRYNFVGLKRVALVSFTTLKFALSMMLL
jgi:hypothetical protein